MELMAIGSTVPLEMAPVGWLCDVVSMVCIFYRCIVISVIFVEYICNTGRESKERGE